MARLYEGKRQRIFKRDKYKCRYCGVSLEKSELSIDHVMPTCKGGSNDEDNLVTACYTCNNLIKHTKTLEECGLRLIPLEAL